MFESSHYELIDFGHGTKIERFGETVIARETPSVERFTPQQNIEDVEVDASFDSRDGDCAWHGEVQQDWQVAHQELKFLLRQTPSGQVGVFPEQAENWDWIAQHRDLIAGKRAINLFAYTGGSTLALAAAGAEVTHVDSASSVVSWASDNARLSGLGDHPIRWIVEDAMKFMRREIKRGKTYDIVVADPPSFGRSRKAGSWKIERDLDPFFQLAGQLCPSPVMAIASCHSPTFDASDLSFSMEQGLSVSVEIEQRTLQLATKDNRQLPSGECARFVVKS